MITLRISFVEQSDSSMYVKKEENFHLKNLLISCNLLLFELVAWHDLSCISIVWRLFNMPKWSVGEKMMENFCTTLYILLAWTGEGNEGKLINFVNRWINQFVDPFTCLSVCKIVHFSLPVLSFDVPTYFIIVLFYRTLP